MRRPLRPRREDHPLVVFNYFGSSTQLPLVPPTGPPFTPGTQKVTHYLEGDAADLDAVVRNYERLLSAAPVDLAFVGIGENGHIAFNDPHVADFNNRQLVKRVTLAGIAGDRSVPNLLFNYDTERHYFQTLGGVVVDRSPYYSWRARHFDSMTVGADAAIFMAESDRGGRLFLYLP